MTTTPERRQARKAKKLARGLRDADVLYRMERDAVLRSLDPEKLLAHFIRWRRPVPKFWGKPDAPLAIMHRARLDLPGFDHSERLVSALWLVAHQYGLPEGVTLRDGLLVDTRAGMMKG
jgi:hypothetical protein